MLCLLIYTQEHCSSLAASCYDIWTNDYFAIIYLACQIYRHNFYNSYYAYTECTITLLIECLQRYVSFYYSGLPLSYDIEIPTSSETAFTVGARPITGGEYDLNFVGSLASLVIMSHVAPSGFSSCVQQCLEDITVNRTGTSITVEAFDPELRQLELFGPDSPSTFQSVLQTVTYLSLAPDINVAAIRVEANDGINSTAIEIPVFQNTMRKRRDVDVKMPELHHLLSVTENNEKENENVKEDKSMAANSLTFYWPLVAVALSTIAIAVALLVVWGLRRRELPQDLA